MRLAAAAVIAASSLGATACVVSVDSQALVVRDEKRFDVKGTPELNLRTFDGSIEIRAWDKPDVLVEIEKRGATRESVDALVVQVEQDADRIVVEVKRPSSETFSVGFRRATTAKLIVSVPRRANIMARTGDGSIRVERVSGRLELHTGDGSIHASDVGGQLTLNTGDGSVHVDRGKGLLEVDTGDGSVEVAGQMTGVKLHTGDGSIVFRADAGTSMLEDWEISTGDGSVTLYLPEGFDADLDAHTNDGGIRNELRSLRAEAEEGERTRERDENSRRTMRGPLGDGGKQLKIRTGDGAIRLRVG